MRPQYLAFDGHVLIKGYAPDGDSVRFVPDVHCAHHLADLARASLLRRSDVDGSVQLRLEGIDAPELHYRGAAQPRGLAARDALLAWLAAPAPSTTRRSIVAMAQIDRGSAVAADDERVVRVLVLARSVDVRGRVIAYVLPPRAGACLKSRFVRTGAETVLASANHALVATGDAYPLAYTSQPADHRALLRDAAREARRRHRGVWSEDRTVDGFTLAGGRRAIEEGGALVMPKLFRRSVDYLAARASGAVRSPDHVTFAGWLAHHGSGGATGTRSLDHVVLPTIANIPFASVVREHAGRVQLTADPIDLVFVEH